MKKIVYLAVSISLFAFACQPKETKTEQAALPHQFGIVVDTSANISLVLKTFEAVNNLDSAAIRSFYTDTATVYDNLNPMPIDKNIGMMLGFKKAGLTLQTDMSKAIIFEMITSKPDRFYGNTNYVNVYSIATFKKGDKSASTSLHAVLAIQDGKIKTEWDYYDGSVVEALMK